MNDEQPADLVWGARDIAKACGLKTANQVYAMLQRGHFDGVVRRVGHKLVASRQQLHEHFTKGEPR
jgi:hypothetical protein